jgi:phosphatidylserine/phosphatidylglycerophosphate/cardiolipin synthase-like enzyme
MALQQPHVVTEAWLDDLRKNNIANQRDDPNYWSIDPDPTKLISTSMPVSFRIGTGFQILSSVLPFCAAAEHEVIIVTCFWAKSPSQEAICSLLQELSSKALAQNRKLQVRLCFSSFSPFQKLFQTSSLNGRIYPVTSWTGLGLPRPEEIRGLDLVVKSVFVRPFSVMHPKFILVDRKTVFIPSCNVSWESWFEGCIEMRGEIAEKLFEFWNAFWSRGGAALPKSLHNSIAKPFQESPLPASTSIRETKFSLERQISTILLPSPHHANPGLILLRSMPPPTPLNLFLLQMIACARRTIFIQTPNLTSQPIISALLSALARGINIQIITSSKLMILEQLVTAGTITEFEIWKLRRQYQKLLDQYTRTLDRNSDPENLMEKPGTLRIGYYHAKRGLEDENEPMKSHLKLVIMDEEITVLGSGNQDRASWYTSQELGVALLDEEVSKDIMNDVLGGLRGRLDYIC